MININLNLVLINGKTLITKKMILSVLNIVKHYRIIYLRNYLSILINKVLIITHENLVHLLVNLI